MDYPETIFWSVLTIACAAVLIALIHVIGVSARHGNDNAVRMVTACYEQTDGATCPFIGNQQTVSR